MSVSITTLTRYEGEGSYSIFVAILFIAILIVGAILFISSCVTIGTLLCTTLGGLPGFLFLCLRRHFTWLHPWRSSRFSLFCCLHRKFNWRHPWRSSRFSFFKLHPWSWSLVLLLTFRESMRYSCAPLVWFQFHFQPLSIIPVGLLLLRNFRNYVE